VQYECINRFYKSTRRNFKDENIKNLKIHMKKLFILYTIQSFRLFIFFTEKKLKIVVST